MYNDKRVVAVYRRLKRNVDRSVADCGINLNEIHLRCLQRTACDSPDMQVKRETGERPVRTRHCEIEPDAVCH